VFIAYPSTLERIQFIGLNACTIAKQQDQDSQANGRLCRSYCENEKHKNLTVYIAEVMRERNSSSLKLLYSGGSGGWYILVLSTSIT